MYRKCFVLLCILYVWTLYVRQCHIFENVLLYVVTDGPFGLVFINKLVKHHSDLDLFYSNVQFGNLGFSIGKRETIEACDLKVGRYRQLIDFMKVCKY